MKMELIDGSETSAIINQTPGNYPKGNLLYEEKLLPVKIPKIPSTQITLYYSTSEVNMCVCVTCYQVEGKKVKVQPPTYHEGTEAE